jgi:hypothetical protein
MGVSINEATMKKRREIMELNMITASERTREGEMKIKNGILNEVLNSFQHLPLIYILIIYDT